MKDYLTYITQYSLWLKNKCTSDFKWLPVSVCNWNMMHVPGYRFSQVLKGAVGTILCQNEAELKISMEIDWPPNLIHRPSREHQTVDEVGLWEQGKSASIFYCNRIIAVIIISTRAVYKHICMPQYKWCPHIILDQNITSGKFSNCQPCVVNTGGKYRLAEDAFACMGTTIFCSNNSTLTPN